MGAEMDGFSAVRLHQAGRRRHRRGGRTGRGGARRERAEARTARGLTLTGMAACPPSRIFDGGHHGSRTPKLCARTAISAPRGARHALVALRHLRSEEHTSELQSLMRISYAVFCLKKKKTQ